MSRALPSRADSFSAGIGYLCRRCSAGGRWWRCGLAVAGEMLVFDVLETASAWPSHAHDEAQSKLGRPPERDARAPRHRFLRARAPLRCGRESTSSERRSPLPDGRARARIATTAEAPGEARSWLSGRRPGGDPTGFVHACRGPAARSLARRQGSASPSGAVGRSTSTSSLSSAAWPASSRRARNEVGRRSGCRLVDGLVLTGRTRLRLRSGARRRYRRQSAIIRYAGHGTVSLAAHDRDGSIELAT
jgi:hypothetical protein